MHAIRFNRLEDLCPCEQTKDMKFLEGQACRKPEFIKIVVVVAFSHPPEHVQVVGRTSQKRAQVGTEACISAGVTARVMIRGPGRLWPLANVWKLCKTVKIDKRHHSFPE